MRKFFARLAVVTLAAGLIVGVGFALQHVQSVASFFSKDGRADGTNVPRAGASKPAAVDAQSAGRAAASTAGTAENGTSRVDDRVADSSATAPAAADPAASTLGGNEAARPGEDKADFERWPDLTDTAQLLHALRIMVPIGAVVIAFDVFRRRSRHKKRVGAIKQLRGAQ
jgi:hypothetical protein